MGLDVSAYNRLEKMNAVLDINGWAIDPVTQKALQKPYVRLFLNNEFPNRADEFEDKAIYRYQNSIDISCGGYGRYNKWRNDLAKLAGYPREQYKHHGEVLESYCIACWSGKPGPFAELINFSDCEGVIGTAVSKKLAADFASFQDQAGNEYFGEMYAKWRSLFEYASDSGCVVFS